MSECHGCISYIGEHFIHHMQFSAFSIKQKNVRSFINNPLQIRKRVNKEMKSMNRTNKFILFIPLLTLPTQQVFRLVQAPCFWSAVIQNGGRLCLSGLIYISLFGCAAERMNFRSISVTAPGKIILHGEHAVVYGKVGRFSSLSCLEDLMRW